MHGLLSRQDLLRFCSIGGTRAIVGGQRLSTTAMLSAEKRRNEEMVHSMKREGRARARDGSRMEDDERYEF